MKNEDITKKIIVEPKSPEEISLWLQNYISELKGINLEKISPEKAVHKYGLDSASAVTLTGDLIDWLKINVDPAVFYEYPSIDKLSKHLSTMMENNSK